MNTAIVGAGAAGLSLAMMVPDALVFEREPVPGGLCRSYKVDGFTFDRGPHILGGIPHAVDWIVGNTPVEWVTGQTRNRGHVGGEWVPHPFANEADGLAYMAKMWKTDPADLSLPGLGAQTGRKPGGVREWRYPAQGGYQAITDDWADQLSGRVLYDDDLRNVGPDDRVIWTAPLTGARYNSLGLATLGYQGNRPQMTAIYLPESWTPFHRLSFPASFSPSNAPKGCWSVQGEMTFHGSTRYQDLPSWLEFTLNVLGITRSEPVMRHVDFVHHAYPVPLHGVRMERGHGRTGGHRYLNVDGVVAESMALAAGMRDTVPPRV